MIWATVSSRSCFCWLYRAFPSGCKEYNQSDFSIHYSVFSIQHSSGNVHLYSLLFRCWKRFAMTSVFSWQNSISLFPASFCNPRPNLPVTPGISDSLLVHSSPLKWKGHLFWVLVLEGLVGLHRTVQLQLFKHYRSGHRLGLLWYWMVCLGNEQRSFCCFWDCIQVLHFKFFCLLWWLLYFF